LRRFVNGACAIAVLALHYTLACAAEPAADVSPSAESVFNKTCAACHGAGGIGGDRAPPLANSAHLRSLSNTQIAATISGGTPAGMPAFTLPDVTLNGLVALIRGKNRLEVKAGPPAEIAAGERIFFGSGGCSQCHMVRGRGGVDGPDLSFIALRSSPAEIESMLDNPTAQIGAKTTTWCPPWAFCPDTQWAVVDVELRSGGRLRGFARNQGEHDLELQTLDGKLRLLTEQDYVRVDLEKKSYMPPFAGGADARRELLAYLESLDGVPPGPLAFSVPPIEASSIDAVLHPAIGNWPSYDLGNSGNRYSPLAQINVRSVADLKAEWVFAPGGGGLEDTPVVIDGIMYVTGARRVCALDARNGRSIWCAARTSGQPDQPAGEQPEAPRREAGIAAPAAGAMPFGGIAHGTGPSRGVAVLGDRVYFVSDDAFLVCLNRVTGALMWVVPLADPHFKGSYYNTAAPIVVNDLVVSGVAGGDTPLRGFLAAFKANTGKLAWRFWTIPRPGEPGSETWKGPALPTGGGATWTTGSYDPDARLLYWAVGNPYPATNGSERVGKNLYTDSVVALHPNDGSLQWYFQFTPHDLHDWDASAPLVLADARYQGQQRKLLLQANRNGFFYVLDRITGQFLRATPFVRKLDWASGVGPDGVPILGPKAIPTSEGTLTCPSVRGATNWYATSFNPITTFFYVMAAEDCSIYRPTEFGYAGNRNPLDPGTRYLRALDVETGRIVWEKPLTGAQESNYTGVLSTAGGLVFHGETGGAFAAVDARSGKTLWTFPTNDFWRASPMSYAVDGRQFVAAVSGGNVIAFALSGARPDPRVSDQETTKGRDER
jgi:PQQ-dependent dehydrogenase (methanol/ethanol family)